MKVTVNRRRPIQTTIAGRDEILVNQAPSVGARRLDDLIDVDTSGKVDGAVLVYDEDLNNFIATRTLEKQDINGGHF